MSNFKEGSKHKLQNFYLLFGIIIEQVFKILYSYSASDVRLNPVPLVQSESVYNQASEKWLTLWATKVNDFVKLPYVKQIKMKKHTFRILRKKFMISLRKDLRGCKLHSPRNIRRTLLPTLMVLRAWKLDWNCSKPEKESDGNTSREEWWPNKDKDSYAGNDHSFLVNHWAYIIM